MQHLTDHEILSYLESELEEAELERIEEHIEACDDCADQLAVLAELRTELPEELLPLKDPSNEFVDRVMEEVTRISLTEPPETNVVPFRPRKKWHPRLEVFTRFMTAAVVTGFMVIGSSQVQGIPMLGQFSSAVGQTGDVVSEGTARAYAEVRGFLSHVSIEVFDREGRQ